jgi:hypothetical protein
MHPDASRREPQREKELSISHSEVASNDRVMSSQFDTTSWLSTALMFSLVGAGVLQTTPRNSGRPPAVESLPHSPLYSQQICARLWQDPLEAARRVENEPRDNRDAENERAWLAAPAAFLEQTQLDYRTRKLIALALREKWPRHDRSDTPADSNSPMANSQKTPILESSAQSPQSLCLSASKSDIERLKKALASQALFELRGKVTDSGQTPSKFEPLFAQAIAIQRDTVTESPVRASIGSREEQSTSLITSLTEQVIKEAGMTAGKENKETSANVMRVSLPFAGDSKNLQPHVPVEQSDIAGYYKNASLQKALHSLLVDAMLAELIPNEANATQSPRGSELTLEKILESPERKTLLLPIIVPEQMYPEVREQRLRIRYAVVSALAAANFNPESADELNLVPVPICTKLEKRESGSVLTSQEVQERTDRSWIPVLYEIFRRPDDESTQVAPKSEYWQVVVFWIDARITKKPFLLRRNITAIVNTLCPASLRDLRLLSTQGSETLTEILASENGLNTSDREAFYFPFATVPKERITTRVMERMTSASRGVDRQSIVTNTPVKRVQASDDYLVELLLDELSMRLPSFGERDGEICLFYETDSFYGRSMVDVFSRGYRNFTNRSDAKIESIPYLKGIDGTLQLTQEQSQTRVDLQDTTALLTALNRRMMEGKSGQWVLDQRQIDYLERQAHYFKSSQSNGKSSQSDLRSSRNKLRAIGVFGTNVFDKIKVIEILRKEFKNVWFFTVDLDASLINNDNPLATRNVLIGSALDLNVKAGHIKSPQFRDSYQSAAFLSTLDALGLLERHYPSHPGVWETSRVGFERLEFKDKPEWLVKFLNDEEACKTTPANDKAWSWETFLKTHFKLGEGGRIRLLRQFLLILTTGLLIVVAKFVVGAWTSPRKPSLRGKIVDRFEMLWPAGSYKRELAGMFAAVSGICVFGWLAMTTLDQLSEPFRWFDGVSVWPSLLIRGFAAALGFYLLMRSLVDIDAAIQSMSTSKDDGFLRKGLKEAGFSRSGVRWRDYLGLLTMVTVFVLFQWALINMLNVPGGYFTPARGRAAFLAHEITLLFSMAVFYLLVWSAVLRHLRCRELLNKLALQTRSESRPDSDSKALLPRGALSKPEIDALLAYNQAVVQSILYPFAMLVVLLASRHPVFDAWNFPASLLFSNVLILGVLVFCAYLLNEAANQFAEDQKMLFKPASDVEGSEESAIWEKKELSGSFIPFWKQPVIQALTLAVAGVGLQWIQ